MALERERVGIHMTEPQEVLYIPGRKRWTVAYRGGEVVKPTKLIGSWSGQKESK
jgi:hypothetical protein